MLLAIKRAILVRSSISSGKQVLELWDEVEGDADSTKLFMVPAVEALPALKALKEAIDELRKQGGKKCLIVFQIYASKSKENEAINMVKNLLSDHIKDIRNEEEKKIERTRERERESGCRSLALAPCAAHVCFVFW